MHLAERMGELVLWLAADNLLDLAGGARQERLYNHMSKQISICLWVMLSVVIAKS